MKLKKAIKTCRKICKFFSSCVLCPFYKEGMDCYIFRTTPDKWPIEIYKPHDVFEADRHYRAVKTIHKYCIENKHVCDKCLYCEKADYESGGICMFNIHSPDDWKYNRGDKD